MRIFVQTNRILIKHKNTMRSFDKANCRQGVVSAALAPFGVRSGLGRAGATQGSLSDNIRAVFRRPR